MTDNSNGYKDMTERDLKNHIELLKRQISGLNSEIRKSIGEIKLHRESLKTLREKRDELNAAVRECLSRAEVCRKARDDINQKIADLKKLRDDTQNQINQYRNRANQMKERRDKLNAIARMHTTSLEKAYAHELYVFIHADIPLKHEIDAYERLKNIGERLNMSREADAIHSELITIYKQIRELRTTADDIHQVIQGLADESQHYHDELLGIYKELDAARKEANSYHARLKDKYHIIDPLSKSIDAHKASVANMRKELSECLDALKERQQQTDTEDRKIALEKFKTSGRMSLEDLRVLMEHNDISFD